MRHPSEGTGSAHQRIAAENHRRYLKEKNTKRAVAAAEEEEESDEESEEETEEGSEGEENYAENKHQEREKQEEQHHTVTGARVTDNEDVGERAAPAEYFTLPERHQPKHDEELWHPDAYNKVSSATSAEFPVPSEYPTDQEELQDTTVLANGEKEKDTEPAPAASLVHSFSDFVASPGEKN